MLGDIVSYLGMAGWSLEIVMPVVHGNLIGAKLVQIVASLCVSNLPVALASYPGTSYYQRTTHVQLFQRDL